MMGREKEDTSPPILLPTVVLLANISNAWASMSL
jgi:hypothetical protein